MPVSDWQVHKLDPATWKSVEVVPINIADGEQVAPEVSTPPLSLSATPVSLQPSWVDHASIWRHHVENPGHYTLCVCVYIFIYIYI